MNISTTVFCYGRVFISEQSCSRFLLEFILMPSVAVEDTTLPVLFELSRGITF